MILIGGCVIMAAYLLITRFYIMTNQKDAGITPIMGHTLKAGAITQHHQEKDTTPLVCGVLHSNPIDYNASKGNWSQCTPCIMLGVNNG